MGFIHEQVVLPFSDLLKGEKVHYYMRQLRDAEQWDEEKMRAFQEERLRIIVQHAAKTVPFYRNWFAENAIDPEGICTLDDLKQLPIMSKAIMRGKGIDAFTAEGFLEKHRLLSRSSGSTGEPFSFYVSKGAYSVNMAAKLRTWYQAGYRLGDHYMKIANGTRKGKMKKMQDCINNCNFISFYSVNDDALKTILDQIEKARPKFIRSYPIPLYLLAQYRNSHEGFVFSPNHVMTTGSTLPQAYREEIEKAFGCDVIDSYSCEGTPNTYETPQHDGYQVCGYYGIIEVLDNQGQPVENGVGRVVSTDLWNDAHPFLRYDTQDLVEVKNCKIMRIMGRECEAFIRNNGEVFTVHNFSRFFLHDMNSVDAYQIVRHKENSITIRIVVNERYTESVDDVIANYWQQKLSVPVKVSIVDEIPLMNNNKRLTIIDEA